MGGITSTSSGIEPGCRMGDTCGADDVHVQRQVRPVLLGGPDRDQQTLLVSMASLISGQVSFSYRHGSLLAFRNPPFVFYPTFSCGP